MKLDVDSLLRLIVTAVFFYWNVTEGAIFENNYPLCFVKLYQSHAWHLLLMSLVIAAAFWCPTVSIMAALAVFFYVLDFESISLLSSI
jgi:hypothetical protein